MSFTESEDDSTGTVSIPLYPKSTLAYGETYRIVSLSTAKCIDATLTFAIPDEPTRLEKVSPVLSDDENSLDLSFEGRAFDSGVCTLTLEQAASNADLVVTHSRRRWNALLLNLNGRLGITKDNNAIIINPKAKQFTVPLSHLFKSISLQFTNSPCTSCKLILTAEHVNIGHNYDLNLATGETSNEEASQQIHHEAKATHNHVWTSGVIRLDNGATTIDWTQVPLPTVIEIKENFLRSDSTDEMKQQAAELCHTLRQLQSTSEGAQSIFISFPPFVEKNIMDGDVTREWLKRLGELKKGLRRTDGASLSLPPHHPRSMHCSVSIFLPLSELPSASSTPRMLKVGGCFCKNARKACGDGGREGSVESDCPTEKLVAFGLSFFFRSSRHRRNVPEFPLSSPFPLSLLPQVSCLFCRSIHAFVYIGTRKRDELI
ncbi:hypothetical protein BLNAU_22259 [Blattamonas nauphoetae]|uniref:Uncharacterized protein n=1 Tax=Blattamonas nauphoetae TaxID=2049346 RepID=A0ABQ9WTK3_9EUKA|nr:hypothetical protein BLNAU_22259 [Blattamonas nauphoetae]